jgi:hypothetical protein
VKGLGDGGNASKIIISLCDYSGNWPRYYREAGYDVRLFDLKRGGDVRLLERIEGNVYGILAAPVCTMFAGSGAWARAREKRAGTYNAKIGEALALVDACLRQVVTHRRTLKFWALENPVGTLRNWIGAPAFKFDPCDFGGYAGGGDAYTKKTLLWGDFITPTPRPVEPVKVCAQGSWIMRLGGSSARTKELRSMTPLGFARAFFEANP